MSVLRSRFFACVSSELSYLACQVSAELLDETVCGSKDTHRDVDRVCFADTFSLPASCRCTGSENVHEGGGPSNGPAFPLLTQD